MEELIKKAAVPGALAFGGIKIAQKVAPAGTIAQLVGGILGAVVGVAIGMKVA